MGATGDIASRLQVYTMMTPIVAARSCPKANAVLQSPKRSAQIKVPTHIIARAKVIQISPTFKCRKMERVSQPRIT